MKNTPTDGNQPSNEKKDDSNGSSWSWSLSSIRAKIDQEMDQQRHERLAQCRVLESILADCKANKPDRTQLEDVPAGIRMVRYFDWRNLPDPNCQREAHSVWACRAIALKCGSELVQVRNCFQNELGSNHAILEHADGAIYEPSSPSGRLSDHPCGKIQKKLGDCVATNAKALHARDVERNKI